ncbi:MAG: helix-turn-helix transcriptional regulator, partial [Lentilitoribacter sp.]
MDMTAYVNVEAEYIKELRRSLGLGRTELANLLGLGSNGERTVRGWEEGEHQPSKKKWADIQAV